MIKTTEPYKLHAWLLLYQVYVFPIDFAQHQKFKCMPKLLVTYVLCVDTKIQSKLTKCFGIITRVASPIMWGGSYQTRSAFIVNIRSKKICKQVNRNQLLQFFSKFQPNRSVNQCRTCTVIGLKNGQGSDLINVPFYTFKVGNIQIFKLFFFFNVRQRVKKCWFHMNTDRIL